LSKRFKSDDTPRERAHGDGMLVSVDSPEAFEEAIWCSFWQRHYRSDHIVPWAGKKNNTTFDTFYSHHISKIVFLDSENATKRYVSKNNLNIARIPYLKQIFPDSIIIVPVRHPLDHARSLWHQHQRFCEIHHSDEFARRYMRDIGHFDFGANLKPVKFAGEIPGAKESLTPDQLAFWLDY